MAMVDVDEAQLTSLRTLLNSSDALCSAVISGAPGTMKLALEVARALDALKRSGFKIPTK